jgi:hypothetical protein
MGTGREVRVQEERQGKTATPAAAAVEVRIKSLRLNWLFLVFMADLV